MMKNRTHCNQPDHDGFAMRCGYPLPCPWHTAIIHIGKTPPTVELPVGGRAAQREVRKLRDIAKAAEAGGEQ